MSLYELPEGYKNLRYNIAYLSVAGVIFELLGWLCWVAIIIIYTTGGAPPSFGFTLFFTGLICIAIGKTLHYLRKTSIINYEILQQLKEQNKKSKE